MQIDFYSTFSKKENSTKQPTGSASLTLTGYLIEPSSVMSPTVKIERLVTDGVPEVYTYAYIPVFQRYYFVKDWNWVDGLWQVHMEVDVLGSWKTYIGNLNEYILRTNNTTSDFNGAITDTMYPATTDFSIQQVAFTNPFITSVTSGTFIVGIISGDSQSDSVGAITYYALTHAQFGTLKQTLFGDDNLTVMGLLDITDPNNPVWNAADMSEEIFKTMYNPYQYIASCIWFPISTSDISGTAVTSIKIGWWNYSLNGKLVQNNVGSFFDGVTQVPVHTQAATRGKYLNYAPYSKITMYGKFGTLPIDTSFLEIGSYIVNNYMVDYITGQCVFQVFVADNAAGTNRKLVTKTEFLIGVPIQLAQIGRDYLGVAVNAVDTIKSAGMGAVAGYITGGVAGAVAGGIISGANGIYDTIQSSMPQLQTSGSNGSFICAELSTTMTVIHYVVADENIAHKGRPLCENRTINTLSGFIQCAEGDVDIPCFFEEKKQIGQYMISGFYWE